MSVEDIASQSSFIFEKRYIYMCCIHVCAVCTHSCAAHKPAAHVCAAQLTIIIQIPYQDNLVSQYQIHCRKHSLACFTHITISIINIH